MEIRLKLIELGYYEQIKYFEYIQYFNGWKLTIEVLAGKVSNASISNSTENKVLIKTQQDIDDLQEALNVLQHDLEELRKCQIQEHHYQN